MTRHLAGHLFGAPGRGTLGYEIYEIQVPDGDYIVASSLTGQTFSPNNCTPSIRKS